MKDKPVREKKNLDKGLKRSVGKPACCVSKGGSSSNTASLPDLVDIVDKLTEMEDTLSIEDKVNKISATIACHGAGRKMKLEEMNEILRQIEKTPYSGRERPTYIEMKLSDIEKLFERR